MDSTSSSTTASLFPQSPFSASRRRSSPGTKLGFHPKRRAVAAVSVSEESQSVSSRVKPVYEPTPPNRDLRTPHSGYHFDGSARLFFEGWYFKVSIPEYKQTFCFMYSVENPAFPNGLSVLDRAVYGPRFTGVGVQILGADDKYICQYSQESKNFWGSKLTLSYLKLLE